MSELLSQSERSLIYKELDNNGEDNIIWKVCGHANNDITELENEFNITSNLAVEGVRKPVKRGVFQNKEAFAYQYLNGTPLSDVISKGAMAPGTVYSIALSIVQTLKQLHQNGVFHLRLNPANIIYNPRNKEVYIIDFSIATKDNSTRSFQLDKWGDELAYMAPEITGRLNQSLDSRTDMYSLGVIIYEMLSGHKPFDTEDRSELIHEILVKNQKPLSQSGVAVNQATEMLVEKLLAKDPKDRYQTTHGLAFDLEEIIEKSQDASWNGTMELGREDSAEKFYPSEKLYGRQKELAQLNQMFEAIGRENVSEVCLISGKAGMGKTTLVSQFKKEAERKGALVLTGKFERMGQNIPHQAMVSALREFSTFILSRPDEELSQWKKILNRAVGEIGSVLTELVPDFEWIIEDGPVSPSLTSIQTESRINFLFQQIIEKVASPTRPLILIFDDLQWADQTSIKTLVSLVGNRYADHFLFIGTYGTGDAQEGKWFEKYKHDILSERPDTIDIELKNLSINDVKNFVKDSIKVENSTELSELIHAKTLGNPFFVWSFLNNLQEQGILQYSSKHKSWVWDKTRVNGVQISDNAIDYITEKINNLTPEQKSIISFASIIGNPFSKSLLRSISDFDDQSISVALEFFISEHFIEPFGSSSYIFTHDRIQQTAYKLISTEDVGQQHYKLAGILRPVAEKSQEMLDLFELARHYKLGKDHHVKADRQYVIDLNLKVGLEAKKNASFQLAHDFFKEAIHAVDESDWSNHYEPTLRLHHEAAEAGMMLGEREDAERWIEISLSKAKYINDRVRAHEIMLNHLSETHQFSETIDYLLKALDEIGYGIKRNPSKLTILKEFAGVKWQLRNKKIEDIPNLPMMEDDRAKAFVKLTVMATISIYGFATDILPIVFFRQVKLSLKYGNSIYSPNSYASYGFALIAFMGDLDKGYRFGKMGMELAEKLDAKVVKTKVKVIFYAFLSFWKNSLIESLPQLKQAYLIGRQTGDLFYAAFALSFQSAIKLQTGEPLGELANTMEEDGVTLLNMGQEMVHFTFENQRHYSKTLAEVSDNPMVLKDEEYERVTVEKMATLDDQATAFEFYYYKMALAFIFNDYNKAEVHYNEAMSLEDETTPWQITYPNYVLLGSLAALMQLSGGNSHPGKSKLEKLVAKNIKLLTSITKEAPQNYANKLALVKAMKAAYGGKEGEAANLFMESITHAQSSGFVHEEAVAREHFGYFLINTGKEEFGHLMLKKAFSSYQDWGALSKCVQLKERFPEILKNVVTGRDQGIAAYQNTYDLNTIIHSNQVLSSENTLEGLLGTMTQMMINNASIGKVVIILKNVDEQVSTIAYSNNKETKVITDGFNEMPDLYPKAVVNVVSRTKSPLVNANLSADRKYNFDRYIQNVQPVSVCCLPIMAKEDILGTIYFENNLAENAFDAGRVEFFTTITAQLAISIDNVMLYANMEHKVNERTTALVEKNNELAVEKKKSDDLLLNILPAETAEELKNYGKTTARSYSTVTVLFVDIRNFSHIAETLSPEELVSELDLCFKAFDSITMKYGLEKIKTIGDAYMAAGGIPESTSETAPKVIKAAIAMRDFTLEMREQRKSTGGTFFEVRAGIHTGPIVAGVVGTKKFQFDIWGNTVNLAARMEQNSEPGKVNVSQATYDLVKGEFSAIHRGKVGAKNMGEVDMYFVEHIGVYN